NRRRQHPHPDYVCRLLGYRASRGVRARPRTRLRRVGDLVWTYTGTTHFVRVVIFTIPEGVGKAGTSSLDLAIHIPIFKIIGYAFDKPSTKCTVYNAMVVRQG